jgi:hypothetical protein
MLMKDELEDLAEHRLNALINIEANKARVGRWYDKKVKAKSFDQGDLVWKLVLPIGTKDLMFGKWSPTWEGPYRVNRCVPGNAYILETLEGEDFFSALNGKYLKKILPKYVGRCIADCTKRSVGFKYSRYRKGITFSVKIRRDLIVI